MKRKYLHTKLAKEKRITTFSMQLHTDVVVISPPASNVRRLANFPLQQTAAWTHSHVMPITVRISQKEE
jgi:hypothetical protein